MGRAPKRGMEICSFTELVVWQRAMDLVVDVYRLTEKFPPNEQFVLTAQTHKSAIAIPSNIAEGFRRGSVRNFVCEAVSGFSLLPSPDKR